MSDAERVWILWWRYSDGSGMGLARAYGTEDRAMADLALLIDKADSPKQWAVEPMEITE